MQDVTKNKKLMRIAEKLRDEFSYLWKTRRDYKSSIFAMIFQDKKEALALYNAVSGRNHTNPDDLKITTLANAIYLDMKNDVSFLIDSRLYLMEHQSTVNPNMPLRDLFYVARQYEKLYGDEDIYLSTPKRIPAPFFVTLYNGLAKQPERKVMRLSDLYVQKSEGEEVNLELKVLQLNINPGYNEQLKEKCKTLREYVAYVEKVRRFEKVYPLGEAVERAIEECMREGILSEFFRSQKKEALRMILFEYDKKKYEKLLRKHEREEGRSEREVEIFQSLLADGIPRERAQRIVGLSDEAAAALVRENSEYLNT